jgi:hypothetical protein
MFLSDCVVVLPFSEISIKSSSVRRFMFKKLKENISLSLSHFNLEYKFIFDNNRFIVLVNDPKGACLALKDCFGVAGLFLAKKVSFSSLDGLCESVLELCKGNLTKGSFAVRGKSYSKDFSSKELEIELGARILASIPDLKVNLSSPDKEVFCIVSDKFALVYFDSLPVASGMPVGVQGKAGILINSKIKKDDFFSVAKNLLYSGCVITVVSDSKVDFSFEELESFNCFKPINVISVVLAKEQFAEGRIKAFFSCASSSLELEKDNALIGTKCFAPLLF